MRNDYQATVGREVGTVCVSRRVSMAIRFREITRLLTQAVLMTS